MFVGLCAVAVLAGRLLFGAPLELEIRFLVWLASIRSTPLNTLEQGITFLGSTFWLACLSLAVGSWMLVKRRPADLALLLVAGLGSDAITNLVKVLVERHRPGVVLPLVPTSTLSFPSGHACSSAAVYMALALILTKGGMHRQMAVTVAAVLAIAIAFSRVYLGVHYPTDALAGLALGWLWTTAAFISRRVVGRGTTSQPARVPGSPRGS